MRRTALATVLATLATLFSVVLLGGPASAQVLAFDDPAGDVQAAEFTDSDNGDDELTYHHTSTPNGDVVSTRYEHSRSRVYLWIHYREIYLPRQFAGWYFRVSGSNHQFREISLVADSRHVGGRTEMINGRGRTVHCAIGHRINYTTNSVALSFPRSCLQSPSYVRVGNVSYWFSFGAETGYVYFDDPARVGGGIEQVGGASRWIRAS